MRVLEGDLIFLWICAGKKRKLSKTKFISKFNTGGKAMRTNLIQFGQEVENRISIDKLISKLNEHQDFYDVISWIAQFEYEWEDEVRAKYSAWTDNTDNLQLKSTIENAIEVLSQSIQADNDMVEDFSAFLCEIILENRECVACICLFILQIFDKISSAAKGLNEEVSLCGYLNSEKTKRNILIYPLPPEAFQSKRILEARIRANRNLCAWNPISPLNRMKNFLFIPWESVGEFAPLVFSYYPPIDEKILEKNIKIAIAPISKDAWFDVQLDEENKQFKCSYSKLETNQRVNDYLCAVIKDAAEKNVNIIVFPEMAANPSTEKCVKEYLLNHPKIKESVIFIVMGTNWMNGVNEGCILSGSGSEIIRTKKRTPFSIVKRNNDDICEYMEYLSDTRGPLIMFDVNGIGRVSWVICRDLLADQIRMVSMRLSCALQIVSAYTEKTSEMFQRAKSAAAEYGMITALCNHCVCNERSAERGFVYVPCIDEQSRFFVDRSQSSFCNKQCQATDCFSSVCYWICTISKELDCTIDE